jgi:hypothetical protein
MPQRCNSWLHLLSYFLTLVISALICQALPLYFATASFHSLLAFLLPTISSAVPCVLCLPSLPYHTFPTHYNLLIISLHPHLLTPLPPHTLSFYPYSTHIAPSVLTLLLHLCNSSPPPPSSAPPPGPVPHRPLCCSSTSCSTRPRSRSF